MLLQESGYVSTLFFTAERRVSCIRIGVFFQNHYKVANQLLEHILFIVRVLISKIELCTQCKVEHFLVFGKSCGG